MKTVTIYDTQPGDILQVTDTKPGGQATLFEVTGYAYVRGLRSQFIGYFVNDNSDRDRILGRCLFDPYFSGIVQKKASGLPPRCPLATHTPQGDSCIWDNPPIS